MIPANVIQICVEPLGFEFSVPFVVNLGPYPLLSEPFSPFSASFEKILDIHWILVSLEFVLAVVRKILQVKVDTPHLPNH